MTQENKELLLKDLCSRLPYGVKVYHGGSSNQGVDTIGGYYTHIGNQFYLDESEYWAEVDELKPYLRPMSSMTEEEKEEFESIWNNGFGKALDAQISNCDDNVVRNLEIIASSNAIDWLNKKMFDYRGLIPKGLAIEAPEGMYELKEK